MPQSSPTSGDFGGADGDDFISTIAGKLGWTSAVTGTGAANTHLSTLASTAALLKFVGGVVSVVGTTAAGIAANELLGMTLNNANGMGVDVDFLCAIDTALPNSTNGYCWMLGVFDSSGAVTTGNFIGAMYGYNPVTNTYTSTWALAADTVAHLIASTPTAVFQPFTGAQPAIALDQDIAIRLRINTAWNVVRLQVNGVDGNVMYGPTAGQTTSVTLPNITNGWIAFKQFALVGTANTGKVIMDAVDYAFPGRYQAS